MRERKTFLALFVAITFVTVRAPDIVRTFFAFHVFEAPSGRNKAPGAVAGVTMLRDKLFGFDTQFAGVFMIVL